MKSSILYFLLLVLGIALNFCLNIGLKWGRFSKTLLKEDLKFVLWKKDDIIAFNLSLVLLLAEVNLILEKQSHKWDALVAYSIGYIKMILILSTKIITLHVWAFIIQIRVLGLKEEIAECKICLKLAIILAFNEQF